MGDFHFEFLKAVPSCERREELSRTGWSSPLGRLQRYKRQGINTRHRPGPQHLYGEIRKYEEDVNRGRFLKTGFGEKKNFPVKCGFQ